MRSRSRPPGGARTPRPVRPASLAASKGKLRHKHSGPGPGLPHSRDSPFFGQGVVPHVSDNLLSVGPLHPIDELLDRTRGLSRRVEIEKPADWIAAVLGRLEIRRYGRCGVVLLDLESLDTFEIGDPAVSDAEHVAFDGIDDGRGAGQRLRVGSEILVIENVLFEIPVGARIVFAAVEDDVVRLYAHILPVLRFTEVDLGERRYADLLQRTLVVHVNGESIESHLRFDGGGVSLRLDIL